MKDQIWKPWIYLENVILGTTVVGETSSLQIVQTGPEQNASVKNANEFITFDGNNVLLFHSKRLQVRQSINTLSAKDNLDLIRDNSFATWMSLCSRLTGRCAIFQLC